MGTAKTSYFGLTGDKFIDAITHGYYWKLDATRTINYSISNGFNREFWYSPGAVANYLGNALDTFSNYANIKFSYSGYYTNPSVASFYGSEINLSLDAVLISNRNIWAVGFFPNSDLNYELYEGAPGDIFLNVNSQANSLRSYEPGSQGWFLLIHELGHTLGLKHPHDDGGTGRPTFSELGISNFDIDWASVMSYKDDFGYNYIKYDPATPMIYDVLALQYIYGKNLSTNIGNSTYKLSETNFYYTLWDAAGTDLLDASSASNGWTIYLPEKALSTLVDTKVGYAVPTSELQSASPKTFVWLAGDYENVNGSAYADLIYGNAFANTINGNGGNDIIYGEHGNDVINGGNGNDVLYGEAGNDTFDWDSNSRDGNDAMYGGRGNDTYVIDSLGDLIIEYQDEGTDTIWSPFSYSIAALSNVENLYLFGSGNINAIGNSLNNKFFGTSGNNLIDGGNGVDTAIYSGAYSDYSLSMTTSSTIVRDKTVSRDGTDTLINVERLKFSDTNIALDIYAGQNAGMAYRMYKAALNRAPDLEGLGDWIYVLDNGANIFTDLARGFTESLEFKARYGPNISNNTFVTLLYNNVLGRAPDQDGLNAWVSAIEQRGASREVVLHGFSESPENISYSLGLIGQGMPYIEHLG